jgi:Spy/CpxP family protein refolding chaperone
VEATDDQRALVVAKAAQVFKGLHEARGDHKALREEVLGQWNSDKPDAARLHALVDERIEAMRNAAHAAVDAGIEVHGAFNAEQRASLGELAAKRMDGIGGRHHRRGHRPDGDGPPEGADKE